MARLEIRFLCESEVSYARVTRPTEENDIVSVELVNTDENTSMSVWFDKSTAIKFAKTIRTEINRLEEVKNG